MRDAIFRLERIARVDADVTEHGLDTTFESGIPSVQDALVRVSEAGRLGQAGWALEPRPVALWSAESSGWASLSAGQYDSITNRPFAAVQSVAMPVVGPSSATPPIDATGTGLEDAVGPSNFEWSQPESALDESKATGSEVTWAPLAAPTSSTIPTTLNFAASDASIFGYGALSFDWELGVSVPEFHLPVTDVPGLDLTFAVGFEPMWAGLKAMLRT